MTSLLSSQFLFIFSLLSLSKSSPLFPLLSLNCTPPSNQTLIYDKPILALLDILTTEVTKTRFTTANITSGHDRFTGLMQCRFGLNRSKCTQCAQSAKQTLLTLCPNSNSIASWFDGCYIQYSHNYNFFSHAKLGASTTRSCSNRTDVDPVQFEPALETLLMKLRAEVNLATHYGFSYGDYIYGNGGKIYGLVECVRSLLPKECEVCVGEAIEKIHEYCGNKFGGTVVFGFCLVRFESYQFYSYGGGGGSDSGGGSGGGGGVWKSEKSCGVGCKEKLIWVWCGVVVCLFGVVLFAWLLRRSVINRAKVAIFGVAE